MDEGEIVRALALLAADSRVYGKRLEEARLVVERLAADVDDPDLGLLLTSLTIALAEPPRHGTPRHVERLAAAVVRSLT